MKGICFLKKKKKLSEKPHIFLWEKDLKGNIILILSFILEFVPVGRV